MSAEPLVVEFEVGVAPRQAFETWTRRCATWWPRSHTMSGDPSAIIFEPRAGGRIVEHGVDGDHEWGEVLAWEPPDRLRCLWHPFFDRSEATELDITFRAVATGTAIRLEQSGWDRLGDAATPRRTRTEGAWSVVTAAFADGLAAQTGSAES
jgi:Activator of Hsp90 ATPase homolog 1-like protein